MNSNVLVLLLLSVFVLLLTANYSCWFLLLHRLQHSEIQLRFHLKVVHFMLWPVIKEYEVALQRAEMRVVRWMCGIKLQDRFPSKGLRERLGLDDIISVLQQNRLR